MSVTVTILGPNLPRIPETIRHGETFHVHVHGCADVRRYGLGERSGIAWTTAVDSFAELAGNVYSDQIGGGSMDIHDAMSDIWLAPCVGFLPDEPDPLVALLAVLESTAADLGMAVQARQAVAPSVTLLRLALVRKIRATIALLHDTL